MLRALRVKLAAQKTCNNDIGTRIQQDLITTLSQKCTLKIDIGGAESRMGDLFVSMIVLFAHSRLINIDIFTHMKLGIYK